MHPDLPQPLPLDLNEGFLRLWTRHEPVLRAIVRSCVWKPEEVDEVMQEVSVVAWRKFPQLTDPNQFPQWAAMIARYEILMARRRHARERLVLSEETISKLAEEGAHETTLRDQQLHALDTCINKLPTERRDLALAAYAPGASIRDLAAQLNRTEGSLYQLLARIRQDLLVCVEKTLIREAHTS
ncbi:MAG: sigma-70 family RNA polymerase sigma factor [Verrucomicrobiota bacterium]